MGVAELNPGSESTIYGESADYSSEKLCMVATGSLIFENDSHQTILETFDCVYVPPNTKYKIRAASDKVFYIWVLADSDLASESSPENYNHGPRVIKTLREIQPKEVLDEKNRRTLYEIKLAKGFNFGIIRRATGTFAPMHTHDPPDSEEAFIALTGELQITDTIGSRFILKQFDSVYIPPFGGNLNKNIGTTDAWYAYAEAPATEIREIRVREKHQ